MIVVTVKEVYYQCAKALRRARLWSGEDRGSSLPTAGQFIKEQHSEFDAEAYDEGYGDDARDRLW